MTDNGNQSNKDYSEKDKHVLDDTRSSEYKDREDKYGGYRALKNTGDLKHDRDRSMNLDFESYGKSESAPDKKSN